jgi:16S rRNA (cytidine1402-2'-O)-methyltransferase
MRQKAKLFVVATPIGNLEDITLRALRILKEVEAIACEDTRQTAKLLNYYRIKKRLISYFRPREYQKIPEILNSLKSGHDVALVSDAGTPGISDPGFPLIREAIQHGIQVVPIPGPSALTAALSAGGLPANKVVFAGFPPAKKSSLKKFLAKYAEEEGTLVFFLPMRKIVEFVDLALEVLGPRQAVLARELTKIHEEFVRGNLEELLKDFSDEKKRGEATIIIQGK